MFVFIVLAVFCVFFTWLQQIGAIENGLKISYFLIFLFLSLRYDFGNDYMPYLEDYLGLQRLDRSELYFKGNEVGWLFLNYLYKSIFGDLGFHFMLAGMAAFTCFVLYRFTIKYISPEYYALSIALLLFEPNNILVLCSAMRQSIAVGIFLLNIDSLIEKRYVQYTAGILLASLFHSSVLFFLVLILVNFVNWKIHIPFIFFTFALFLVLMSNAGEFFKLINLLLESQGVVDYSYYSETGFEKTKMGFGFALNIFMYLFILIINREAYDNMDRYNIIKMTIFALFLVGISIAVPMASRLSFYIFPCVVCAYTYTLNKIKEMDDESSVIYSNFLTLFIGAYFIYVNFIFWQSEVYSPYFLEYKSIFSSPLLN